MASFTAGVRYPPKGGRDAIEDQIAEGDEVMTRSSRYGIHTWGGFLDVPATSQKTEAKAIVVHRIVGGKVEEEWSASGTLAILRQLRVRVATGAG